ncbi:polyprenyl synthetase family protein [Paludisphaera mucosa]|uniref:Polyprenyl synthetase family protein n=1 Tax=Paludisphaera mucosa TaxID=3030827 RepID=A0ABT6FDN0_9BACT|nr:polyprenyl synthetase family protein [Paludisphaera mucosa]MDG3005606.1 polyprenyl synthetase family protein [Paludisphaera mucosa]
MTRPSGLQAEESRRTLGRLFAPIQAGLADAERIFQDELRSRFAFVQALVDHCGDYQGKRLRPALVLLSGGACGRTTAAHPVLAAVVEMIHTATLVHDDVLDESMVRRYAATVNAEWGNEQAVMLGDYLFSHAYHLAASLESTLACRWIGKATHEVCEGEMQQLHHRGNLDLDEASYNQIIAGKTAALTAVSCRLGAHYAGAEPAVVEALEAYGSHIGMAFQIADDVLDIWGDERATGKSLGTDLEKQKLTLPLIRLLEVGEPAAVELARRLLNEARADARRRLRPLLEDSGSLDYAWSKARWHVERAVAVLEAVGPSPFKDVLSEMAEYVVRRSS